MPTNILLQVLQELPKKIERVVKCEMNSLQRTIYTDAMKRSKKTVYDLPPSAEEKKAAGPLPKKKVKPSGKKEKMYLENSSNVLMDLRKASSHPMLFRTRFTDEVLTGMTKQLLKEPDFKRRGALFDIVKEDMEVMTDAELQTFCSQYKVGLSCLRTFTRFISDHSVFPSSVKRRRASRNQARFRCS